jgi:hypothetical protein
MGRQQLQLIAVAEKPNEGLLALSFAELYQRAKSFSCSETIDSGGR